MSDAVAEPDQILDALSEEATFSEGSQALPDESTIGGGADNSQRGWLIDSLTRLSDFTLLRKNWDNQGSAPPTPRALSAARDTLFALAHSNVPRPHLTPSDDGAVTFEWGGSDISLTIDVYSTHHIVLHYMMLSTLEEWEGDPAYSPINVDKLFRHLSED